MPPKGWPVTMASECLPLLPKVLRRPVKNEAGTGTLDLGPMDH